MGITQTPCSDEIKDDNAKNMQLTYGINQSRIRIKNRDAISLCIALRTRGTQ